MPAKKRKATTTKAKGTTKKAAPSSKSRLKKVKQILCEKCSFDLDAVWNFCPNCGVAIEKPEPAEQKAARKVKEPKPVVDSPFTVQQKKAFAELPTGTVLSFGSGDMSQLGLGSEANMIERKKPTVLPNLKDVAIKQISAGALHNAVVSANGEIFTWGCNDDKALGRLCDPNDDNDEWLPKKLQIDTFFIKVCCGASHSIALTANGDVYTWGTYRDSSGVIGHSAEADHQDTPQLVEGLSSIVDVACGDEINLALAQNGTIYQWGDLGNGQRVSKRLKFTRLVPRTVTLKGKGKSKPKAVKVFCGGYSAFALDSTGKLWVWGPNNYGQCGVEAAEKGEGEEKELWVQMPTLVNLPNEQKVVALSPSIHHTILCTEDGQVYAMGRGASGRLGTGTENDCQTPTLLSGLSNHKIVACGVGEVHSLAVADNGNLFSWGDGTLLQLGNGEEDDVLAPYHVQAQQLQKVGRKVLQADGGSQHSLILAADGGLAEEKEGEGLAEEKEGEEQANEPELPPSSDDEEPETAPDTSAPLQVTVPAAQAQAAPLPVFAAAAPAAPELMVDNEEPELPPSSDDEN